MSASRRPPLVLRAARFGWNFASDSDFRSVMLLRWKNPENLFQPFAETSDDRYPEIFRLARDTIGDGGDRRILSFGCATGEELFTLRRYFPLATLKGLDINWRSIAVAKTRLRRLGLPGMEFEHTNSAAREPDAHYDAIFAMAVFRHGALGARGREGRCDHLIRFSDFEETVADLARALRPRGLLFITHSNFRFGDTRTAGAFDVIHRAPGYAAMQGTTIFDRNNRYVGEAGYDDVGFRKRDQVGS